MTSEIKRLADMMYGKEKEAIIKETTAKQKQIVQDGASRGLGQSGMLLGKLCEIESEKLKRFSKARIDIEMQLLQKHKGIIKKNDITRINDWLKRLIPVYANHSKRHITERCAQSGMRGNILTSLLKQLDRDKMVILADSQRELEIQKGQINLEAERKKQEKETEEIKPVSSLHKEKRGKPANKFRSIKNWTMDHPLVALLVTIVAGVILLAIGYFFFKNK